MKVFCMNDCDWVAANTLEEALAFYKKDSGIYDEDCEDAHKESIENMNRLMYRDEDMDPEADARTFAQQFEIDKRTGIENPYLFASTEI